MENRLRPTNMWLPFAVTEVAKLAVAKYRRKHGHVSLLRFWPLLIFDRDADAWQAVHDARQELGV